MPIYDNWASLGPEIAVHGKPGIISTNATFLQTALQKMRPD